MEHTIEELQTLLSQLGYLGAGYQEGVLDEPTIAALRLFQRCHALAQRREPDEPTWNALATADRRGECVVVGRVTADGAPIDRVAIEVRDRDLGEEANWSVLGTPASDPDGHFFLIYAMEQVLPGDRRIGRAAVADLAFRAQSALGDFVELAIARLPEQQLLDADEVALFIGQQFQQLANEARSAAHDMQRTQAVRDAMTGLRASLAAERQEPIKQELSLYEIV